MHRVDTVPSSSLADLLPRNVVVELALVAGYAAFIGIFAQISVSLPFTPVPITGQTFAVLLGAAALGPWRATLGSLIYLVLGIAGVPWFAGGSHGVEVVASASFGYLVGFVVASWLVGRCAKSGWDRKPHTTALAMAAGNLAIYGFGVSWLAFVTGSGAIKAMQLGLFPFVPGDVLKLILATALLPGAWMAVRRFSGLR